MEEVKTEDGSDSEEDTKENPMDESDEEGGESKSSKPSIEQDFDDLFNYDKPRQPRKSNAYIDAINKSTSPDSVVNSRISNALIRSSTRERYSCIN